MATWNLLSLSYAKDLALQNTGVTYKHFIYHSSGEVQGCFPLRICRIQESRGVSSNGFSVTELNNSSPGRKYCFSHCLVRKTEVTLAISNKILIYILILLEGLEEKKGDDGHIWRRKEEGF